jgi:diguanylate cyclase
MDCKKIMEQSIFFSEEEKKRVQEVAKFTINFMSRHDIPLTPLNYREWFYVICQIFEDNHILSEKNLRILYKKYKEDLLKLEELEKKEIREVSLTLQEVANSSGVILERIDKTITTHSGLIDDSIDAIDAQDTQKIKMLRAKIVALEEENKKLRECLKKNRQRLKKVERKLLETTQDAYIDPLTKVFNRKRFDEDIEKFDSSCKVYSVIFLDIDNFKQINDIYGHAVGDRVLKEVGEILRTYLRRNTYAYRYGGEEFVVVLPNEDIETAKIVAKRLQEVIEHRTVTIDGNKTINFTASFGVAQKREGERFEDVLKRADEALYEAKRSGKNRVVLK